MTVRYTREFKPGSSGIDVEAVGRALARAHCGMPLVAFVLMPKHVRRYWGPRKRNALKRFKRKHGIRPVDAHYGKRVHKKLSPYFDSKARHMMQEWEHKKPADEIAWSKMFLAMQRMNRNTQGYVFSAGHGSSLASQDWDDPYDCSSSTSKALFEGGMFPSTHAWSSWQFDDYGLPGKGEYFTVYYNSGHVFIRLHGLKRWRGYWRFDTSPYGDTKSPKSGPRLRYLPRPTWGFTARHWKGM